MFFELEFFETKRCGDVVEKQHPPCDIFVVEGRFHARNVIRRACSPSTETFLEKGMLQLSSFVWRKVFQRRWKEKGEKEGFFFFSKERKKAWNFSFFSPKKRSPKRLSFANSVSHRPRVKQKTGKEITAPFPGKIYFRESASDKVLDKVPLDGVPQKSARASARASARGVEEINRLSEMKLGHWYLFLTVEV